MTESNSGLDAIEQRFQRRNREVRPPRRPRAEIETDEQDTTDSDPTPSSDEWGQPEQPAAEARDSGPEAGNHQGEQAQPSTDVSRPEGSQELPVQDSDRKEQDGAAGDAPEAALQRRIAEAVVPLVSDLKRQLADAVQQGMTGTKEPVTQQDSPAQGDERGGQTSEPQGEAPVDTPPRAVLHRTVKALKTLLQWLARALRAIARAIRAAFSGLWHLIRSLLMAVLKKIVLAVLRAIVRVVLRRLTRALEGESGAARQSHEQHGKAA